MSDKTDIEWTDATWNPIRGCSRVSPGCGGPSKAGGCYAEKIAARFSDPGQPFHGFAERTKDGGRWTGKVALIEDKLTIPLRWKKPRRIFVNSMSDLFHENLPDEAIDRVFAVMALCPQHTFQVLTKRPERMRTYILDGASNRGDTVRGKAWSMLGAPSLSKYNHGGIQNRPWPLPNVWLGVSAERQQEADERIPLLEQTPAAVKFVSLEPLLGPIDISHCGSHYSGSGPLHLWKSGLPGNGGWRKQFSEPAAEIQWVIVGGESGPHARPMHPDWARSLRDQCAAAGVSFFFKQWGEWAPGECAPGPQTRTERVAYLFDNNWDFGRLTPRISKETHCDDGPDVWWFGKSRAGRLLDGVEHNAFPEVRIPPGDRTTPAKTEPVA